METLLSAIYAFEDEAGEADTTTTLAKAFEAAKAHIVTYNRMVRALRSRPNTPETEVRDLLSLIWEKVLQPLTSGPATRANKAISDWIPLFKKARDEEKKKADEKQPTASIEATDGSGTTQRPVRLNHFAKGQLKLEPFKGDRGAARLWWSDAKKDLQHALRATSNEEMQCWVPYIRRAMVGRETKRQFAECENLHTDEKATPVPLTDVKKMMEKFCDEYDQHSLDMLLQQFYSMRQRDSEGIIDFRNRFNVKLRLLEAQGHTITKEQKWHHFKNKCRRQAYLREHPSISTIESAVQQLLLLEDSKLRTTGKDSTLNWTYGRPPSKCQYCGRQGHTARNCRTLQRERRGNKQGNRHEKDKSHRDKDSKHDKPARLSRGNRQNRKNRKNYEKTEKKNYLSRRERRFVARLAAVLQPENETTSQQEQDDSDLEDVAGIGKSTLNHVRNENNDGENSVPERRLAATEVELRPEGDGTWRAVAALWDSGSIPHSYISLQAVQRLNMTNMVISDKKKHKTAKKGESFSSIGYLEAPIRLGRRAGATTTIRLLVAPIGVDLIIGQGFMSTNGGVVNFHTNHVHACRLKGENGKHIKLKMIRTCDWPRRLGATSATMMAAAPKTLAPEEYRKRFPGLSLRQIAERLEQTPDAQDLTPEQGRERIRELLNTKYKEITEPISSEKRSRLKPVRLPVREGMEEHITNVPMRPRPSDDWDKIEEQVAKWEKAGIVTKSNSPFNAPHVLAKKATPPFYRLATDFRRLNKTLKPLGFPVRKIEIMAHEISKKKWKSALDLQESYLQVPVHRNDQHRLAFSTRNGKYHYTVVPFGISCSAELFSQRKSEVLSHDGASTLLWIFLWYYIDDDTIGTNKVITSVFILEVVFVRFKMFQIRIRMSKCVFIVPEIKFLGKIIGFRTIKNDPKKSAIIAELKTPTTMKELRSFFGMASWCLRSFAPTYVELAAKINKKFRGFENDSGKLLPKKRNENFSARWDAECQSAFESIKDLCRRQLECSTFDPDCETTQLWFDWSKLGISSVLVQNGKIVAVWGRACSEAESRYFPTKGELLAFTEAQLHFRVFLLSLKHPFVAITDHRPLLGIERKLDLDNTQLLNLRMRTEEFSSRRKLAYVMGSAHLADFWSRIWPNKRLPGVSFIDSTTSNVLNDHCSTAALTFADWTLAERAELAERERRHGVQVRQVEDRLEVKTKNQWRTYVPENRRSALIAKLHGHEHAGLTALTKRLSGYYWPDKRAAISEFLRGCFCSAKKADGNPRGQPPETRHSITADDYLDLVQIDVYSYDDWNYLTFIDVATNKAWVRKLLKKGSAKRTPGKHLNKILEQYMLWESTLPKLPKKIHTDNEPSLKKIPHRNLDNSPVNWPQANGKVERLHRELAKLCRIHGTTPDKAVHYLPANSAPEPPSGGGEDENGKINGDIASIYDTPYNPNNDPRSKTYNGRALSKGDHVLVKVNPRGRAKTDDWWGGVSKVINRVGLKTYSVYDGKRLSVRHIDHLKSFSLRESQLANQLVNPEVLRLAEERLGKIGPCRINCPNLNPELKRSWRGKTIWLAYPGLSAMPEIVKRLETGEFRVAYLVAPELECEPWYRKLDKLRASHWYGCEPTDQHNFWVDDDSNDCGPSAITWWIIKVVGS